MRRQGEERERETEAERSETRGVVGASRRAYAVDRRHAYRVKTPGALADCVVLDNQGVYKVTDLSAEGARLEGEASGGTPLVVGSYVDILLRSPGRLVPTNGRIVRQRLAPGEVEVGVAFNHPWPGAREAVEDMMVDYIIRRNEPPGARGVEGSGPGEPPTAEAAAVQPTEVGEADERDGRGGGGEL